MSKEVADIPRAEYRVFGEHETICLPVTNYVRLPQVRSGANPELSNLKDSIRSRGLINPIDVARMSIEQFTTYIAFVNQLWGTEVNEVEHRGQLHEDGHYYLVVAGHTRAEAIMQLQEEDGVEYHVLAKVHAITDPRDLIALQLDENLYSKPAQEQRAIAIVETYQYGIQQGLWTNKAEFLRQSQGKFSRQILNDAIGFAQLPTEARDFVFSGRLSYNAAVALGKATDVIMEYTAARLGYDSLPEVASPELDQGYRQQVGILIAGIANRSLNGTAAKKYIEGYVNMMRRWIEEVRGGGEMQLFELMSAEEQQRVYLAQLEREYRDALRLMRSHSVETVGAVLGLHRRLSGEEGIDGLEAERWRRVQLLGVSATELTAR